MAIKTKTKTMSRRQLLDPVVVDRTVLELGRERVATAFDRFDHLAVMFSGGKDSTVVLHLALDEHAKRGLKKPIDVIFYDEEAIPYETEEYVRLVASWPQISLRWLLLPTRQNNGCSPKSPYWYPWAPEDAELWCRPMPPEGIWLDRDSPDGGERERFTTWDFGPVENRLAIPEANALLFNPAEHGTVGMLMGIRADESMTRRRSVLRRKEDNWIVPFVRESYAHCRYPGCTDEVATPTSKTCLDHRGRRLPSTDITDLHNVFKCYPIYDWRTEDVWTFAREHAHNPVSGETVWNRGYDLLEMAGLPHFRQRCAPPFAAEPMTSLWTFKVCFPDLWDKMVERVPGAATAARYAKTQLYAFGERPTVPLGDWWDERAWDDLIDKLVRKHSSRTAALTAKRIKVLKQRHNAKTASPRTGAADPILPDIPHPVTGVSQQFLAMVALRGDPKQRKNPEWQVAQRGDPKKLDQIRKRYTDGLQEWLLKSPQSPRGLGEGWRT